MPIRRRSLTKAERTEDLVRAAQLRASGVEIEIPENSRKENPLDIIVAGTAENTVCELRTGGISYVLFVRLVARSGLILTDCSIFTDFDDEIVLASFHMDPICRLGGAEYWQDESLNQRIEDGLVLSCGQMVEGYILATGLRQIPIKYGGLAVPFGMVFSDQFGDECQANGMLSVVRQARSDHARMGKGSGLYGPDGPLKPRELSIEEEARRQQLSYPQGELGPQQRAKR